MTAFGTIPHSNALAEAGTGNESIPELLSRNPEQLTLADRRRMIQEYQLQRENWMKAEASGQTRQTAKANQQAIKSTTTQAGEIF